MELKRPLVALAPLAGTSDKTMRELSMRYGADYCVTEMISAKAVYYKDKKTFELARIGDKERPCGIQLFGSEPDIMAYAAEKMLEFSPAMIDINMGCPVTKIVSNKEGCALMKSPELAASIVKAVKKAAGSVPVSVKFRSGFDKNSINAVEFAKAVCDGGADLICVHGRTREQMYSGLADRKIIKKVKQSVSVPVLANGDIFSARDAVDMLSETGCDGVMVARGALGNPFIFREIKELFEKGSYVETSLAERLEVAALHAKLLCEHKGEYIGVREARKHLGWYIKGMDGSAQARGHINTAESLGRLLELISELKEKNR